MDVLKLMENTLTIMGLAMMVTIGLLLWRRYINVKRNKENERKYGYP